MSTDIQQRIRRAALNLLARREHSELELLRKLQVKKFSISDIKPVLANLNQQGLLSNTRFIEMYIHSRRQKGCGPIRIKAELIERGITEDLIEHHLNIADNAWLVDIRAVWQKRFNNIKPEDFKTRAQQMRFLYYRGFTQEQIDSLFEA